MIHPKAFIAVAAGLIFITLDWRANTRPVHWWIPAPPVSTGSEHFRHVSDSTALGGTAVEVVGTQHQVGGKLEFPIPSLPEGKYRIWMRTFWPGGCANSLIAQVNGGNRHIVGNEQVFGRWLWTRGPLFEATGRDTVKVWNYEYKARFEGVLITNALGEERNRPAEIYVDSQGTGDRVWLESLCIKAGACNAQGEGFEIPILNSFKLALNPGVEVSDNTPVRMKLELIGDSNRVLVPLRSWKVELIGKEKESLWIRSAEGGGWDKVESPKGGMSKIRLLDDAGRAIPASLVAAQVRVFKSGFLECDSSEFNFEGSVLTGIIRLGRKDLARMSLLYLDPENYAEVIISGDSIRLIQMIGGNVKVEGGAAYVKRHGYGRISIQAGKDSMKLSFNGSEILSQRLELGTVGKMMVGSCGAPEKDAVEGDSYWRKFSLAQASQGSIKAAPMSHYDLALGHGRAEFLTDWKSSGNQLIEADSGLVLPASHEAHLTSPEMSGNRYVEILSQPGMPGSNLSVGIAVSGRKAMEIYRILGTDLHFRAEGRDSVIHLDFAKVVSTGLHLEEDRITLRLDGFSIAEYSRKATAGYMIQMKGKGILLKSIRLRAL